MTTSVVLLLVLLQLKHFVVDFPLQVPYMYLNKGNFNHLGGYFHAGLHACVTGMILLFFTNLSAALWIALMESYIHYIIDWSKVNFQKKMGWGMTTHEQYWWLLGFDQLLHQLTYVAIIALVL